AGPTPRRKDISRFRWAGSQSASGSPRLSDDVPAGPVNQQVIQGLLHVAELLAHLNPQIEILPQLLGLDAANDALGLFDQFIELLVGADIEPLERLEELSEIGDCHIPEHFGFATLL